MQVPLFTTDQKIGDIERELHAGGVRYVVGLDEAGRGPLAGPVYAGAVVIDLDKLDEAWLSCLDDSKKLKESARDAAKIKIVENAVAFSVAFKTAQEIDEINILCATHKAMGQAIASLSQKPDIALVDGLPVKGLPVPHEAVVKGDGLSLSIAAASVIAKVTRDRFMEKIDQEFPAYGFARHQGYGTRAHIEALTKYGPCRHHRRSFQPVSQLTLPPADGA